jgi:hypothetical protein
VDGQIVRPDNLLSLVAPAVLRGVEELILLGGQHVEHEELLAAEVATEGAVDLG